MDLGQGLGGRRVPQKGGQLPPPELQGLAGQIVDIGVFAHSTLARPLYAVAQFGASDG
jgi:hypothetical protein